MKCGATFKHNNTVNAGRPTGCLCLMWRGARRIQVLAPNPPEARRRRTNRNSDTQITYFARRTTLFWYMNRFGWLSTANMHSLVLDFRRCTYTLFIESSNSNDTSCDGKQGRIKANVYPEICFKWSCSYVQWIIKPIYIQDTFKNNRHTLTKSTKQIKCFHCKGCLIFVFSYGDLSYYKRWYI